MSRMNVGVIGAGYVGLSTAAGLGMFDAKVLLSDVDQARLLQIGYGLTPYVEEELAQAINNCIQQRSLMIGGPRLVRNMVRQCRVIFVCVGTPSNIDGSADLSAVSNVAAQIADELEAMDPPREDPLIVVVKSTVPPGTAREITRRMQMSTSAPFHVVSNPEFLREGNALDDFCFPDRIVIGHDSAEPRKVLDELYEMWHCPKLYTSTQSAEMIKYASNAFLATKISFINEMAEICEVVGADVREVAHGMGLDERIAPGFLEAGLGWSGVCFPKDLYALRKLAEDRGRATYMLNATAKVNQRQAQRVIKMIDDKYGPELNNVRVAILGLAFKPGTPDVRGSISYVIANHLSAKGATVVGYDPIAGEDGHVVRDVYAAVAGAHVAVVCTAWPEIKKMDLEQVSVLMARNAHLETSHPLLIDGRNCFEVLDAVNAGFVYKAFGR